MTKRLQGYFVRRLLEEAVKQGKRAIDLLGGSGAQRGFQLLHWLITRVSGLV